VTEWDTLDERATAERRRGAEGPPDPAATGEHWDDVDVKLSPKRPRIAPGFYEAKTVALRRFRAFDRENLELGFDVYAGAVTDGVVLARIPKFFRRPAKGKPLPPSSDLACLFYRVGLTPRKVTAASMKALRHKVWRVQVGDAEHDSRQRFIADGERYSVIKRVLERLA
jgi:hypothetical protein